MGQARDGASLVIEGVNRIEPAPLCSHQGLLRGACTFLVLADGADKAIKNSDGKTARAIAVEEGDRSSIITLLDAERPAMEWLPNV